MARADYDSIRQRLDHPRVVMHDPCAPTLAADDPEWPAPTSAHDVRRLEKLVSAPICVRMCVVAAVVDLDRGRIRAEFRESVCRAVETLSEELSHWSEILAGLPDDLSRRKRQAATAAFALSLVKHSQGTGFGWTRPKGRSAKEYWSWWARCRALLPIKDVATAEIEWGDIELPARSDS